MQPSHPLLHSLTFFFVSLFLSSIQAARSIPRVNKHLEDEAAEAANKVQMRLLALQDNIQNYREEYDFVVSLLSFILSFLDFLFEA